MSSETNSQTNKQTDSEKTVRRTSVVQTKIRTVLDFRVGTIVKERYLQLSPEKKKIVKLVLQNIIFSLANDKENLEGVAKELGLELAKQNIQPILNINVNVSESKAENHINIDISKLIEAINELERLLLTIQKHNWNPNQNAYIIPIARMKDIENKLDELRRLVN